MAKAERIVTPIGDLMWVFITGQGKKDLNDNDRFVASVAFDNDDPNLKLIKKQVEDYWAENKGKGWKLKSNAIKLEYVKNEEWDGEDEDTQYLKTGRTIINFWTGLTFPDGTAKVIKTMNAKGVEVSLGAKKIGNGSRGCISGAMALYDSGVAARGITMYLNAIQLTKFVEFSGDAGFGEQDVEDGFTGEDLNDGGFPPADEAGSDAPAEGKKKVEL